MVYFFQRFFSKLPLLIFLHLLTGCHHLDSEEVSADNKSYKFDPKVIEKLPVYDSLAHTILENFSIFHQNINEKDSYRAYRYIPLSDDADVSRKLPEEAAEIDQFFIELGKDFIYGFDVFKDSTIKIYVRNGLTEKSQVEIEENLSYYPASGNIRRRDFPDKDTILNDHWQYWARFNKRSIF